MLGKQCSTSACGLDGHRNVRVNSLFGNSHECHLPQGLCLVAPCGPGKRRTSCCVRRSQLC